jgi:thiol-disulfide isomerase/thioredoxin
MRPTTTNLLLFAAVAIAFVAVGGCVLRIVGPSASRLRGLLRVFARILIVIGFFLSGTLVWGHVSSQMGQEQVWFRAPSFYLATVFLCASTFWWFRRPRLPGHREIARLAGYPILIVLLVGGWQLTVRCLKMNKKESLHGALATAQYQVAPEIQFVDTNGEPHKLSEFKGKVVLVNFWATTCGPCVNEMPGLSELQRKLKDRGFVLMYLSSEPPDVLARFFRGRSLDGVNGRLIPELPAPAFYASGKAVPISFLISRTGLVKDTWVGALPTEWTEEKIKREL